MFKTDLKCFNYTFKTDFNLYIYVLHRYLLLLCIRKFQQHFNHMSM